MRKMFIGKVREWVRLASFTELRQRESIAEETSDRCFYKWITSGVRVLDLTGGVLRNVCLRSTQSLKVPGTYMYILKGDYLSR